MSWREEAGVAKAAEDAVYLAFLKEREGAAEGLSPLSLLFRLAKGPYDHAELVVQHGRRLVSIRSSESIYQ